MKQLIPVANTSPSSCLQCYGYGFAKIEDKSSMHFGAYVHPDFQRDNPTRACAIQRRCTSRSDRRFKNSNATDSAHRNHPCGTNANANADRNDSFSSLKTWLSSGDEKPDVRLDSGWNKFGPRTLSVDISDSLLPSHVSTVDEWPATLQMTFPSSHQNIGSLSERMISFAEFKALLEPRPIELMIKKRDYHQR